MTIQHSPSQLDPSDQTWREIDDLVEEIAEHSKSSLSTHEFHAILVDRTTNALAAVAGALWTPSDGGRARLEYQLNLAESGPRPNDRQQTFHERLALEVLETGRAKLVPPHSADADDANTNNPTDFLLILCPLMADRQVIGVLELVQHAGKSPATQKAYLQVMEAICELASDFHLGRQLRELSARQRDGSRREEFMRRVHQSLDLRETVYTIANEARQLTDCDRASVLVHRGSRCRLSATSGVDTIDRRATLVRRLESLATLSVVADEPISHGDSLQTSPEVQQALNDYLEASPARTLVIVPLKDERTDQPTPIGALVIERFDARPAGESLPNVELATEHSALALRNALDYQSGPLISLLRRVRRLVGPSQLPKTAAVLLFVVATILALVFVPADFDIEARGALQPLLRRDVFAPFDGVVDRLAAEHQQNVTAGEVLAVLRSPRLDLELTRLQAEVDTVRKQLEAVQAARLENIVDEANRQLGANRLTADEEEFKQRLAGLDQQIAILDREREKLDVRSPLDGQVLTWNLKQLLEARPVARGQTLISVADLDGPWVLEVRIPDDRMGHILEAQEKSTEALAVSFVLATEPGVRYQGTIQDMAMTTEVDERDNPSVLVTIAIDRDKVPLLRPGATVITKIHCGRRSLGYVWLHDLFFAVESRLLF